MKKSTNISKVKRLLCLPFFHAAMVPIAQTTPLRSGQVTYIMRRFELEAFLKNIEKYGITDVLLVPRIVLSIIKSPLKHKYSLCSVRYGFIGGAPVHTDSQRQFNALLHPSEGLNPAWRMTETTCLAMTFRWPEADTSGSIGHLLPNMSAKLVSPIHARRRKSDLSLDLSTTKVMISEHIIFLVSFAFEDPL